MGVSCHPLSTLHELGNAGLRFLRRVEVRDFFRRRARRDEVDKLKINWIEARSCVYLPVLPDCSSALSRRAIRSAMRRAYGTVIAA